MLQVIHSRSVLKLVEKDVGTMMLIFPPFAETASKAGLHFPQEINVRKIWRERGGLIGKERERRIDWEKEGERKEE